MSMSAKDYRMLAAVICKNLDETWGTDPIRAMGVESFAIDLASELAKDNPRFDKTRFFKACNIEVSV